MTDQYNYGSAGITLSSSQQLELRTLLNKINQMDVNQLGIAVPLYDELLNFLPAPTSANT